MCHDGFRGLIVTLRAAVGPPKYTVVVEKDNVSADGFDGNLELASSVFDNDPLAAMVSRIPCRRFSASMAGILVLDLPLVRHRSFWRMSRTSPEFNPSLKIRS